jgi:hypothetical protein
VHMRARKDEVNSLREYNADELRGDGADVHRKSGVPVLYDPRWKEMLEWESQIRYTSRGNRVCGGGSGNGSFPNNGYRRRKLQGSAP